VHVGAAHQQHLVAAADDGAYLDAVSKVLVNSRLAILLLPGVGAQGATPADLARAFTSGPASALVNASRSVIYAFRNGQEDWRTAAALEAARLRREVWAVAGW